MARQQYRWFGEAAWQSANGNAIIALQNLLGSGKKILVHSFEVHPQQRGGQASEMLLALVRCTATGGWTVPLGQMDSQASLPSGISVKKFCGVSSVERVLPAYFASSVGTTTLGLQRETAFPHVRNWFSACKGEQGLVVRPGEAVALISDSTRSANNASWPLLVSGDFVVNSNTYTFTTLTWGGSDGDALVALINSSASDVVTLKRIGIIETGMTVTPYFQLVPIGVVDAQSQSDPLMRLTAAPVDSTDGPLSSSVARLIADTPVLPFGVPQVYATDIGGGAPKGMNYLHTKDLIGPAYGVFFPELVGNADPGVATDTKLMPMSNAARNLLSKGTPIVIREGEALGICSAAETAGTTAVTPASGWAIFDFAIQFSIEPTVIPDIEVVAQTLSGTKIQGAQVLLKASTGGPLPYNVTVTIVNSGTTATVTHNNHGLITGDKVVIKGANIYQNNGVFTITKIDSGSYSYTLASAPGSNPTGTIKATFVFLSGTTDSNGRLAMAYAVPSSQPVIGWVRKSSGTPYYKEAPISGTVTVSTGVSLSALMIMDT